MNIVLWWCRAWQNTWTFGHSRYGVYTQIQHIPLYLYFMAGLSCALLLLMVSVSYYMGFNDDGNGRVVRPGVSHEEKETEWCYSDAITHFVPSEKQKHNHATCSYETSTEQTKNKNRKKKKIESKNQNKEEYMIHIRPVAVVRLFLLSFVLRVRPHMPGQLIWREFPRSAFPLSW